MTEPVSTRRRIGDSSATTSPWSSRRSTNRCASAKWSHGALAQCPHVIVIDDGSDDGTADCIADLPVTVLRHAQRMGKGAVPARRFPRSAAPRLRAAC